MLHRSVRCSSLAVIAVAAITIGCAAEVKVSEQTQAASRCPQYECNSPVIDNMGFHELNKTGLLNDAGFQITGFVKNKRRYRLDVSNGKLAGYSGGFVIAHNGLVGAQIVITNINKPGLEYLLQITAVTHPAYWAKNSAGVYGNVEAYQFQWTVNDGNDPQWTKLCSGSALSLDENLGPNDTVLYEGDRIVLDSRTMLPALDPSWINFGCGGTAVAKLYMNGHVQAAQVDGYTTDTGERQTLLKMFSADYCGIGEAFTVPGQPLD
jgi:hypothetical protein